MSSFKQQLSAMLAAVILLFSFPVLAQPVPKGVKNIVMVHGAFADGSSWSKIIPLLRAKGYNVIAVQNPLTSLADDVAATKRAIALMDGPVLLVGHSYGGMVVTEAGNDPKVVGLLYICALVPNDEQSAQDVVSAFPAGPGFAEFQQDASGFLALSSKGIHKHFAQDLTPGERDILYVTQTPWSTKATNEKITVAAWKSKPSWFIIGIDDGMVPLALARAEAKMIKAKTLELPSSHVPMLSQPGKVSSFIISAALGL
ncbi:MAG: alpha/beta hydrolase [Chitinophagaceae bacterium]|nr:alpha/beta hydrolase [Chitinophagaceae bacterium]